MITHGCVEEDKSSPELDKGRLINMYTSSTIVNTATSNDIPSQMRMRRSVLAVKMWSYDRNRQIACSNQPSTRDPFDSDLIE